MKPETRPSMPPPGASGQYLGFDATGAAYLMMWADETWAGVGFDPSTPRDRLLPFVFVAMGDGALRIVEHVLMPVAPDPRAANPHCES